jgi:hypothetical protein
MGSITKKIFELLESGANIEERRSIGIIIKSNWFDALDDTNRRAVAELNPASTSPVRPGSKGKPKKNL